MFGSFRGSTPVDGRLPSRPKTVALLLLACLVPRAVAAWNWDVLWGDSLHYIFASLALEQANFHEGFAEFGLNTYPLILIPLRHLGIDWQITGKWFGVAVASCAVIPLWGWLRRMFNDRMAVIACLVYAFHGKLIAISPLIIRDPTFWFLLVLSLYYLWRALDELRFGLFLAAGAALTLAIHTRTEGWLLLIPLMGWAGCRWFAAGAKRLRVATGVVLTIAVIPASVAAVNLTWLRDNPRWELLREEHIRYAVQWWDAISGMHVRVGQDHSPGHEHEPFLKTSPPRIASTAPISRTAISSSSPPLPAHILPPPPLPERSSPSWILTLRFLERLAKACTWIGGILLLAGIVSQWRVFIRPEHLTLLLTSLVLLAISRIRYWAAGLDFRYFMPIVIVGTPWMAAGLETLVAGACWLNRRYGNPSLRALSIGGLVALVVACSLFDAPMPAAAYMRRHAALGRWIYRRAGPEPVIAGSLDYLSLDTFYANARVVEVFSPGDRVTAPMSAALCQRTADVVVLWNEDHFPQENLAVMERQLTSGCGYRRIDAKELPAGEDELMVFVKPDRVCVRPDHILTLK